MSSALSLLEAVDSDRARTILGVMAKALSKISEPFGSRLRRIRIARGLTQERLGSKIGLSNRMVAYYEIQGGTPSPDQIARLAKILAVSADELVGTAGAARNGNAQEAPQSPAEIRLWRRLRQIQKLPGPQRRAVIKVLDGFLAGQPDD
jgi:transcriptional regulator with XRE-family HTH domain